ncbi:hydrogenase formation protein HypD [Saccharicrinis sp. GN24d3]|uniref:hydrogenase formation protein HypD n=1 Tax=Saccharicrinis sp. GN24d3 TaxID=3458416 RepID=UPI00403537B3
MKYIDEYRNPELINKLCASIKKIADKPYIFMEVCGGHTMAIQRFGIPSLLPSTIKLISGPGCPVCVTDTSYIDHLTALGQLDKTIICTFGDLIRVPGSYTSLDKAKAAGADIRVVLSSLDALKIATENPKQNVVFAAIGFETTSPGTAVAVLEAEQMNLNNFSILSAHKIMPPAMKAIVEDGVKINGYICPGHVSTIAGSAMYEEVCRDFGLGCVISGFEPLDILHSIHMLLVQLKNNDPKVEIQYKRAVKPNGNKKAKKIMDQVFVAVDGKWRGLGSIKRSVLKLRPQYYKYDAEHQFSVSFKTKEPDKGCICGEILKGKKSPSDCILFAQNCRPENPVGACMVSNEGACQSYFKYHQYGK